MAVGGDWYNVDYAGASAASAAGDKLPVPGVPASRKVRRNSLPVYPQVHSHAASSDDRNGPGAREQVHGLFHQRRGDDGDAPGGAHGHRQPRVQVLID